MDRLGRFHHPGPARRRKSNARGNIAAQRAVPAIRTTPGTEALNSNDFQQGFAGGPRLDLIRHGDCGYDLELSYFQIDGWNSDRTVGPVDPADWLVMRCSRRLHPNQSTVINTQAMVWDYATKLYNAEFNVRWHPSCRVTMLAGFRWVNLGENLVGALEPPTISLGTTFLECIDDKQSLWLPDRCGWETLGAWPLFDGRAGEGRDFTTTTPNRQPTSAIHKMC